MPSSNSPWVTVQVAAEHYAVSVDTIRRMITRGDVHAKRFGPRLVRVQLESIEHAATPLEYVDGALA